MTLFAILVIALIISVVIMLIVVGLKGNFFPFRKMKKDDYDNCYGETKKFNKPQKNRDKE